MPARSPLLETVEAVEATQLPGQMAPRQHAKDAAFPLRSRGERAFFALNEAPGVRLTYLTGAKSDRVCLLASLYSHLVFIAKAGEVF